jgi:hypothetical protein
LLPPEVLDEGDVGVVVLFLSKRRRANTAEKDTSVANGVDANAAVAASTSITRAANGGVSDDDVITARRTLSAPDETR